MTQQLWLLHPRPRCPHRLHNLHRSPTPQRFLLLLLHLTPSLRRSKRQKGDIYHPRYVSRTSPAGCRPVSTSTVSAEIPKTVIARTRDSMANPATNPSSLATTTRATSMEVVVDAEDIAEEVGAGQVARNVQSTRRDTARTDMMTTDDGRLR